jgi:uncharacterized iron-regulated membrane protein
MLFDINRTEQAVWSSVFSLLRKISKNCLLSKAMPQDLPLWKGAVAITILLELLFPLVGVSLLAVLLLECLFLSRVPFLKEFLD